MKRTTLTTVAAIIVAAVLTTMPAKAFAWYCEAHSVDGWGWANYSSLSDAQNVALNQCSAVTYVGNICYITLCY